MKAIIDSVKFLKEQETKFGLMYKYEVKYNNHVASYLSKDKDQKHFIQGEECEFTEEEKEFNGQIYFNVKPIPKVKQNGYAKAVKKEQSRYSGFAVSYVKDLIIAGKIDIKDWEKASEKIFKFMVDLDKTLDQ